MTTGNTHGNLVKCGCVVPDVCEQTDKQTDRQTDRQTHTHTDTLYTSIVNAVCLVVHV